jgi:hypothetical protein
VAPRPGRCSFVLGGLGVGAEEAAQRFTGQAVGGDLGQEVGPDGLARVVEAVEVGGGEVEAAAAQLFDEVVGQRDRERRGVGAVGVGVPAEGGDELARVVKARREHALGFGAVVEEVLEELVAEDQDLLGLEPQDPRGWPGWMV